MTSITPEHLALAVLTNALGTTPDQLPLSGTDRAALSQALESPLLPEAATHVLPAGSAGAGAVSIFSALPGASSFPLPRGPLTLHLADGSPHEVV